ncbi:alpha/beta hydrolase [Neobacillus terrae]|uniref:alpha/beta hydrolase n=1 Tax=Neobacillus terrae TaxID=3034837 RepID=UPI00140AF73C|nr:alpha/beta hydrolase-fold protein [Neobacillus terrae]NHM33018.1 alpha/beta hydrolase [Neobacillus terrae]
MLEIYNVYMTAFNQDRKIRVYLPKSYQLESKNYPVLYINDGQNVFNDQEAAGGVSLNLESYLDENEEIKVIVVAIDFKPGERLNEHLPWPIGELSYKIAGERTPGGGRGKDYAKFIVNELKPFIDKKYRTNQNETSIAGISSAGLLSLYAAAVYPHIFKNVVAFSSAFFRNQEEFEKMLENSDLSFIESLYFDCGSNEVPGNEYISNAFIASNRTIYNIVKDKIPNVRFKVWEGAEHHYSFFKDRVPELFSYLKIENSK